MKNAWAPLIALLISPNMSWAGTNRCYSIKNSDMRHYCLASTQRQSSRCYSIRDSDLKNQCLAEVGQQKYRCYSIREHDRKQRCLAAF